jgi:hypothetical protein
MKMQTVARVIYAWVRPGIVYWGMKRSGKSFLAAVNTTATISLPLDGTRNGVYLDDRPVDSRIVGNTALLEVGSGDYRFEVRPVE